MWTAKCWLPILKIYRLSIPKLLSHFDHALPTLNSLIVWLYTVRFASFLRQPSVQVNLSWMEDICPDTHVYWVNWVVQTQSYWEQFMLNNSRQSREAIQRWDFVRDWAALFGQNNATRFETMTVISHISAESMAMKGTISPVFLRRIGI